jgi:hypothetical protein
MSGQVLWRLEAHNTPADTAGLAADLLLYLRHAPLTMVLVQIRSVQRAYICGAGCAGCPRGRCDPGCTMQLLKRALLASGASIHLTPAPHGLARRSYTRLGFALPGGETQMLTGAMLEPWDEARLCLTWRVGAGRVLAGVVLAVGADGPAPAPALRARGWRGCGLPMPIGQGLEKPPWFQLPYGWPTSARPYVLLPSMTVSSGP